MAEELEGEPALEEAQLDNLCLWLDVLELEDATRAVLCEGSFETLLATYDRAHANAAATSAAEHQAQLLRQDALAAANAASSAIRAQEAAPNRRWLLFCKVT